MLQSTIFSILMILLSKRKVSRDYLAERFSISKRTVSRYLNILEDAGVPIISMPGVNGGVAIPDDYMLDRSFLSEAETLRIRSALEKTADSFDDGVNLALIEKLNVLNKRHEQDKFMIEQDDLYIDCEYGQAQTIKPRITLLSQAIRQRRSVDLVYTDSRGYDSYRTVDPYTLVFKGGNWYVYCLCNLRGDFRLFKLSRINSVRLTSKSFNRIESKLVEKLELEFYNEIYADLEFEFFPAVRDSVIDWLGASAIRERGTKLVATAELPLTDSLYRRLLSFGSSIKVINPPELAEKLKADAKLMLSLYQK